MKPFDYYTQSVEKYRLYWYTEHDIPHIIQVINNPKSWDDISEEFKYATYIGKSSSYGNSRFISHVFDELDVDQIKQNYPELFV